MYKAIIEAHNLKELGTEPVKIAELLDPSLHVLMQGVTGWMFHLRINEEINEDQSITIHISEVKE